jgi:membrane protein
MKKLKTALLSLYRAAALTINHDGIEHAGYLSFLELLALFPFLVLVFAVIGVLGEGENSAQLITHILSLAPEHMTAALRPRIVEIISGPPQGLLTISILGAIWTASSAVEGVRTILNRAYHVATPPAYWFRRSLSILQLLVFTFIVVIGMVSLVVIPLLLQNIETRLGTHFLTSDDARLGQIAWWGTIALLFLAVSYIYYIIPNIRQRFISVAPGAACVVLLWQGAAYLFTGYLSHFDQVNLIYGSLGGIIAAMVFFYICNIIFIFGAELNHQIVATLGLRMTQRESAPPA